MDDVKQLPEWRLSFGSVLYRAEPAGTCEYCGGHAYVSAIYVEQSVTGWHLMIEERCMDCDQLDVTDIPQSQIEGEKAKC